MKNNLRTVSLCAGNKLAISHGWCVFPSKDTIHIDLLNPLPRKTADVSINKTTPSILHSASIIEKSHTVTTTFKHEDDQYPTTKTTITQVLQIKPQPDNNIYYRVFLGERKDISFSSAFDVLIDGWIEDPYRSEKYIRVAYVRLHYDAPLILDSKNTICISPFH